MAELVCLTALGVVSLFTGIVSLGNSDAFMGMFTFMILLVSYALIILTFRKRRTLFKAKEVIYTGYEIYLYILSYIVLMTSCLLIYLHVVQVVSMTSPLIMVTWLVPLVAYLTYESVLIFEKDELNIIMDKKTWKYDSATDPYGSTTVSTTPYVRNGFFNYGGDYKLSSLLDFNENTIF